MRHTSAERLGDDPKTRIDRRRPGIALPALMAMTGHRSVASVIGYFQTDGVADNPAARLLESHESSG